MMLCRRLSESAQKEPDSQPAKQDAARRSGRIGIDTPYQVLHAFPEKWHIEKLGYSGVPFEGIEALPHRRQFVQNSMTQISGLQALPVPVQHLFGKAAPKRPSEQGTSFPRAIKLRVGHTQQKLNHGKIARGIAEGNSMHGSNFRPEVPANGPIGPEEAEP
jgi:hypothetical protein